MAEDTRIGSEVAGYRIEELIGRGGMGAVYLARHLRLGRMVALKLLAPELADNQKFRDRFLRESELAASIDHPNIVPIYDADEADGVLFLAMRYVEGTDLRGLIVSEGRLDPPRTAALAQQLGDALDAAHARGLVHRDVKPANVLLTPRHVPTGRDHAYLSDFGLTKRALSVSGITQTGQIVGTIDYVAPEQVKGDPVDGRADQYSMGCLLYQCLTGSVPFPRDIEVAVLWAHVQDPPPSLAEAGLGEQVHAAIGKALAKDPKDRYETCGVLASSFSEAVGVTVRPGRVRRGRPKLAQGRRARGPAPGRLVRRHPAMAIVVALALIAAFAVPTTIALRGGGPGEPIVGDAVGMIDMESGELRESIPLPARPGAVATAEGSVWVTLPDRGAVIEIDAETMSIVDTVSVGSNPVGIAVGVDSVLLANGGSSTVSRISPAGNNEVVDTIPVPGAPAAIALNDQGVWVADSFGDAITPIDPETGELLTSVRVGDQPVDMVDNGGELWVANAASGSVSRVLGGDEVQPVDVGEGPQAVAAGAGVTWVANSLDGTVSRIEPETNSTDTTRVGEGPIDLAFGRGSLWVSFGSRGSVKRVDPLSGSGTEIALGSFAGSVAVGDGVLWVGVRGALSAHRGGTLTVAASRGLLDKDSIDPALAYDTLTWTMLSVSNDGLVGFRRVGGVDGATMVPNLARSIPEPADGGSTYTFQLRPGVRYSSGDPVRPEDFRRAIERLYTLGSPGNFYFDTIVGATKCQASSCDLSAGIETDDEARTVTFHLVESDPDFLNKLTMPFAFAVPAGTRDTPAGTTPLPATGPYMIERHTPGRGGEVVLVRNPEFDQWAADRPDGFPDRIVFRLESDSDRELNRQVDEVLGGDADLLYGPSPGERIAVLKTTHAGQLHSDPRRATVYMFLNTHVAPFNDE